MAMRTNCSDQFQAPRGCPESTQRPALARISCRAGEIPLVGGPTEPDGRPETYGRGTPHAGASVGDGVILIFCVGSTLLWFFVLFLAYFPYFEKMKVGL
jgi:hypothetical protein